MPDLAMSRGVQRRTRGSLRPSVLFNMFLEKDAEAPDGFARMSRQGLGVYSTVGTGPIHGLYAKDGVLAGVLFTISGASFYHGDTEVGTVTGDGEPSWAASRLELVVTRGAKPYSYRGGEYSEVSVPDALPVRAVAYLGGYFIYVPVSSNRFYWSASQDGRTIDGLDYASAESAPDELLDVYVVNDGLWFLGSETVEFWQLTGSADAPFARVEGMLLKKGIIETGCATEADNGLFWWGHDHMIYRAAQGVPQRISDNGIEEALERSATRGLFSYTYEGHVMVVVKTDDGDFAFDVSTGAWSEFGSYGRSGWRVHTSAAVGTTSVFGDDTNATVWQFEDGNWDDGGHLERRFTAGFGGTGAILVHNLCVVGNPGDTPLLEGQGSDPVMEIRASRNNGKTWGAYRSASLGVQGKYRQRIEKRRWGLFDTQGGLFEFRVTDPVPVRASRVYANEPSGGRGKDAA